MPLTYLSPDVDLTTERLTAALDAGIHRTKVHTMQKKKTPWISGVIIYHN